MILGKHPELHYYQGYHDICSVFLFVLSSKRDTLQMMERLSVYHLRNFLNKSLESVIYDLYLIPSLLYLSNQKVFNYIIQARVEPFFALSWVITWFSHELGSLEAVCRLFDVFLSSHPYFPLYLSSALILENEKQLFEDTRLDSSSIHHFLSSLPSKFITDENSAQLLIEKAFELWEKFPPEELIDSIGNLKQFSKSLIQFQTHTITKHSYFAHPTSPMNRYPWEWITEMHNKKMTEAEQQVLIQQARAEKAIKTPPRNSSMWKDNETQITLFVFFVLTVLFSFFFFKSLK